MDNETVKKHERRGYSRGYIAGMRRREHELRQAQNELATNDIARRDRFFCAALTGLLAQEGNWQSDGKPVNDLNKYVELAERFAYRAMRKMP